jgi:large subunit ribosomal protein L29
MKVSEIRSKSKDELGALLVDLAREQFNLRMQKGTGQLSRPDQIKVVRKNIARVQTVLNEMASASI